VRLTKDVHVWLLQVATRFQIEATVILNTFSRSGLFVCQVKLAHVELVLLTSSCVIECGFTLYNKVDSYVTNNVFIWRKQYLIGILQSQVYSVT